MLKMKDNLLSIIKVAAKEFKPKVEERVKVNLDNVLVQRYSKETMGGFYSTDTALRKIFVAYPPNKILLTTAMINYLPSISKFDNFKLKLRHATLHEIYHLALFKINNKFKYDKSRVNPESTIISASDEGFACYMGLEGSPFLYDDMNKDRIEKFKEENIEIFEALVKRGCKHYPGYMLAKRIADELGEEELFRLVKTLDITLEEIYAPGLYIERRRNETR